jgi:hypothetical protein
VSEPIWLRSAALTASLAGLDARDAVRGFGEDEARSITARMELLAVVAQSAGWARTAAEERDVARGETSIDEGSRARVGALFLAAWFRSMSGSDRSRWVRAFDAETLRLARDAASAIPAGSPDPRVLASIVARTADALNRAPTALELGTLIHALHGDERGTPSWICALARTSRITGLAWREATRVFVANERSV